MLRKILPSLAALMLLCTMGYSQSDAGKIKGKITDETGAPLEFATVKIISNGIVKGGANADENGDYSISPVSPGTYTLKATYAGNTTEVNDITIISLKTSEVNITITQGVELQTLVIRETIPIDQTTTGGTLTGDDIRNIGIRDVNTLAAIVPGVYQSDDGGSLSMRGGRDNATTYYVDGVKVRGLTGLPQKSIGQLTVITGGTPAEYGDMIGGIISITSAAPSYQLSGGAEILTSQFLDPYGFNLFALNLSGPIISKRIDSLDYNKPILGFFFATELSLQKDSDPSALPLTVLTDSAYAAYQQTPLQLDDEGNFFLSRPNFMDSSQTTTMKWKRNNRDDRLRGTIRLDFQPSDNISIKLGGTAETIKNSGWGLGNDLFAYEGNQRFEGTLARGWVRFQQNFPGDKDSKVKNLYYTLQADYNIYNRNFMNGDFKDDYFKYGHIGTFNFDRQEIYSYVDPSNPTHNGAISSAGYMQTSGFRADNLTFDPTTSNNPLMANYDSFIFDYVAQNGIVNPFSGQRSYEVPSLDFLAFFGGLRNGDSPDGVYSLFSGPGSSAGGFTKFLYEQYRLTGQASGEIKGHAIKLGFEYEQRNERFYSVAARPLWNYMRQLTNRHIAGLNSDPSSWNAVYVDGVFQDTVHTPIVYEAGDQSEFDKNLRAALGLGENSTDFVIIDALDPSTFNLGMFSANELLNEGTGYVNYYGFDYQGNKVKRQSEGNFFTDEQNRPMNSFAPTYISAFLQDKFELKDIIFNFGVRVDRFDANQVTLKDPFVLFPTYTAREGHELLSSDKPANVGDNWVPYTDNALNPTTIVGYRNPETQIWYDASGAPTSAIRLRQGGEVQPYLKGEEVSIESFKDYAPQTIVMPRLSFSFPISGEAVFFAHYDVLAQRPGQLLATQGSLLAGQISDYYFLQNSATVDVTNSNLKPERTIDYEVGFKQKLNDFMALSVSAFYREMRDMIQTRVFQDAYPISYTSYDNLDFGTIKGFTFSMNMIRMVNLKLTASYTLQFASGTGSNFSSSRNALNGIEGFTAIRTLLPLDFDQRHRFSGNVDYRFYGDRKGPGIKLGSKTIYPLADAGVNSTFYLGSGTPYNVNLAPDASAVMGGINGSTVLGGTPNGSRLPWQFRVDLKFDKDLILGGGDRKDKEGNLMKDSKGNTVKKHEYAINVYVLMLNAFNIKNVLGVYRTSGLPTNDGYLSTGVGQQLVRNQIDSDAFTYLYTLKMTNPNNYSLPRRVRLGIQLSF
jgi:Carboxypeptidase regulatory-like domain/TonB-dependent Receptor Plug Domain